LPLFQSPSRWGRCCISTPASSRRAKPPFQSPSRWGRCCISRVDPAIQHFVPVSVPFSMGTVLHPDRRRAIVLACLRFSPLLDGDGVASRTVDAGNPQLFRFSPLLDGDGVASSRHKTSLQAVTGFSPLLDGDGVASFRGHVHNDQVFFLFQSPSRWGRCCIDSTERQPLPPHPFQSPSRWGRCCIAGDRSARPTTRNVSVPFSMGTVLHPSRHKTSLQAVTGFSPLLDGDGVASPRIGQGLLRKEPVSVPFSMGTVLHRLLNRHILQHLQRVREALSSQIRFLRRTAPDLRILSSPYVSAIVCVLAFFTPLPHVCRFRQAPV
jgi:hypothetical protein